MSFGAVASEPTVGCLAVRWQDSGMCDGGVATSLMASWWGGIPDILAGYMYFYLFWIFAIWGTEPLLRGVGPSEKVRAGTSCFHHTSENLQVLEDSDFCFPAQTI